MRFSRTIGLDSAKAFLLQALDQGKFPHALLVHGPEGVGQTALLLDVADMLLCHAPAHGPCGKCPGCLGRQRKNLDTLFFLLPLEKKGAGEGEMEGSQVDELAAQAAQLQEDPYGAVLSEKGRIHIAQVRELQSRLSYAESSGRARVVLILWIESMPHEAANALLKLLEEPPADVYFLLSCENRSAMLPTLLSRCMQLAVSPLQPEAFRAALAARPEDWEGGPPDKILPFAEGSLGVLLNLHRHGGEALLDEAGRFLAASLSRDWRAFTGFLEDSSPLGDMESGARLLHFVLRAIRLFHRLEVQEGRPFGDDEDGSLRLARALARQGWDAGLAGPLGHLRRAGDLGAYAAFVESTLAALQAYAKPQMAALGNYLEFAMKSGKD